MPVPVTYATYRNYVFNWDTWNPREVLEDVHEILERLGVVSVKLRLMRPETLREHRLLEHYTAHNFVIVTTVPQLYRRSLIREVFRDYVLMNRIDGVVLIKRSALSRFMRSLETVERMPIEVNPVVVQHI
jgi:hypothetical protein